MSSEKNAESRCEFSRNLRWTMLCNVNRCSDELATLLLEPSEESKVQVPEGPDSDDLKVTDTAMTEGTLSLMTDSGAKSKSDSSSGEDSKGSTTGRLTSLLQPWDSRKDWSQEPGRDHER